MAASINVIITTTLHPVQKDRIQSMDRAFPINDVDFFAICEVDGVLRAAAAFIREDDCTCECYAFTEPSYRRQGMFSELLDLAIETFPEDTEFIFYTNGADPDCMATLKALEAELIVEEHMMEIQLKNRIVSPADRATPADRTFFRLPPLTMTISTPDGTLTRHYENQNGSVNIFVFSSYYYLYGLEIHEELRGKGYGRQLLNQVLDDLASHNPLPLRLQVAGDNLAAVSLYKKTGFQITETLFGYLY